MEGCSTDRRWHNKVMKHSYIIICLLIVACTPTEYVQTPYERPIARTQAEIDTAKQALNAVQSLSINNNREYCGFIGLNADKRYIISKPKRGRKGSCRPQDPSEDMVTILASYHSHGAYSPDYDSEVPSTDDLIGDIEEGQDGYVSTPGGRMWYIDVETQTAHLLCDLNCLLADPDFELDPETTPKPTYSLDKLSLRETGEGND